MARRLTRAFYRRPAVEVAPELLNKLIVSTAAGESGVERRVARIVEVEAYAGSRDPASHAYRGRTRRNATMFGRAGHLYVYFTYGMHWCANVVCAEEGVAEAVLLRAAAPVAGGLGALRGPARLTRALGISGDDDGVDLTRGGRIALVDDGVPPPSVPAQGPRVGVGAAAEVPWRWWVPGDPHVSAYRSGTRAARRRRAPGG